MLQTFGGKGCDRSKMDSEDDDASWISNLKEHNYLFTHPKSPPKYFFPKWENSLIIMTEWCFDVIKILQKCAMLSIDNSKTCS